MKKLLLIVLLISASCISQVSKKTYSKIYLSETIDAHFSKYYKKYTAKYFYETTGKKRIIERDPVLDTVAAGRSEYSVLVFKESSKDKSFTYLLQHMGESGPRNHKRFYDHPEIFKEPAGCIFPDKNNLEILKRNKLVWSSELFVQSTYGFKSYRDDIPNPEVLQRAVNSISKNDDSSREDSFLKEYLGSDSHKNAIQTYGNWKFGCSTMFIISKQYDNSSNMWKYDVFVCHTIIIVKNHTDSNVY